MRVELRHVRAELRSPFVSGHGEVTMRELLLVRLEADDGYIGYGEAAPLSSYDGVALDDVTAALEDCRSALEASDGRDRQTLLAACARQAVLPQAVAAIDLALWDLAGRRVGRPVWELLGAHDPEPVTVNWTIAAPDRAGAAREATFAREHGYGTVKLKVGTGDDAGRVAAVRAAAGPEMAIRLDANGAWSVAEATRWLEVLAPARVELCEEPAAGVQAIAEVASAASVPVAIDESATVPGALDRHWCQGICLKIARCGGITGLIDVAARARAVGYESYIASTLDGPLGIAAALHAAAVLRPGRACGLATLPLFAGRPDLLPAVAGTIAVPHAPGLGDQLERWYE